MKGTNRLRSWCVALALACAAPPALADRLLEFGENFAIESLHYVGTESALIGEFAIIASDCGAEFRVERGSFLGRNDGKVVRLDQKELVVIELIQDGSGGWKERERRLPLEPKPANLRREGWGKAAGGAQARQ
jgi:Tfp pilus assembly protein PilP